MFIKTYILLIYSFNNEINLLTLIYKKKINKHVKKFLGALNQKKNPFVIKTRMVGTVFKLDLYEIYF